MKLSVLWPAVLAALVGCSGAEKPEQAKSADDWDPGDIEQSDVAGDRSGDDSGGEVADAPVEVEGDAPAKKKPAPGSDDYDVTYSDCRALADVYRGAWLSAELDKLNAQKLKPGPFEKAKAQVEKAATEAGDNWLSACEGIVGSPFPHHRLKCALKAKTVQRFDDCWDGKVEDES